MNRILIVLLISFMSVFSYGQMTSAVDNDPRAKSILDNLKEKYDTYKTMKVDFSLEIDFPGHESDIQKGLLIQSDNKYKLDLDQRAIYSNGTYVWLHIKKNNEVQINDVELDESSNMMSPKDMLKLYESKEVVYIVSDEPMLDGKKTIQIDFKFLDSDSEFSKMSINITKKGQKLMQMKFYSKDGSKYVLKINDIVANKDYDDGVFVFDESIYPDIHIEDLRID